MTHNDYEKCWNAFVKSRPDTKSNSKPLPMPDLNLIFKIALRIWCWSKRMKRCVEFETVTNCHGLTF